MANKKNVKWNAFTKGKLGKESLDKIGTYKEAPGGGTPLGHGQKAPSKEWVEEHRVMQPRDENGQFTYNSANAKPLKYKRPNRKPRENGSEYYHTVPPFLRGVELTFAEKGQVLKTKDNEKWKYSISTIDLSVEQMIENCKNYIESEGGFAGMGEGSTIDKKGRVSKVEKESAEGTVKGKKVDISKAGKTTQEAFAEAQNKYKKGKIKFAEKKEPKKEESNDVEFNASEIGNTPEQYKAWLTKNRDVVNKIKEKFPNVEYKHIIAAIKSGKYKKLSDFLGDK